ncbi:MAG: hypothetical protein K2Y39_02970 [Candidatus Obscuribacterales bacterium]|nr:hypothetical protein [Candidatus Obscuribacterales bacterium]
MENQKRQTHIGNQLSRIRRSSTEQFLKAVGDLDQASLDSVVCTIVSLYPAFDKPVKGVIDSAM